MIGPALLPDNRVDTLVNGDQIFPAMLQSLRAARHSINFETYIYWSGSIGREFVDALVERAAAGVRVHVLLDWVGSAKMDDALLDALKRGGVEVQRFHEPHWSNWDKLNNRTHRKLLVVETSTLDITDKTAARDALQAKGIVMLDCPLSGTGAQAAYSRLPLGSHWASWWWAMSS